MTDSLVTGGADQGKLQCMIPCNVVEFVLLYKEEIAARCDGFALAIHDPRQALLASTTPPPPRPSHSTPTPTSLAGATPYAVDLQDPIQKEQVFHDLVVSAMHKSDWDAPGASKTDFYGWWLQTVSAGGMKVG